MKKIIFLLLMSAPALQAQLKINTNSVFKAKGMVSTTTQVNNASVNSDLTEMELNLIGTDQTLNSAQPVKVLNLTINQGGSKTFTGEWEISNTLQLVKGVLTVGPAGKLIYSGTSQVEGNSTSFVNGYFIINGSGNKFYPIGTSTTYAPVVIENTLANPLGVRVIEGNANITLPEGISDAFTGHYWEVDQPINAPIQLSQNGLGSFLNGANPVVLEAASAGSAAQSLNGNFSGSFITSVNNASQPILVIGKGAEFSLVIHDMITPNDDEKNETLIIDNIEQTVANQVKLLDRWGNVVKEWANFANEPDYDFSKLSPGNYICLVTYVAPGQVNATAKGIVTILKSN